MNYKIVPIPSEIARSVRENMVSAQYGHPAFADLAAGYGPCRVCLKTFLKGAEERILFTYNAFENLSNLPLPGPVYIHKDECESYNAHGFPPELIDLPLLFEGFGNESELVRRETVKKDGIETQIAEIFAFSKVNYINIRNAEAGCFVARIERA
ncbi:MAG TPA: DUF1203 domain-containing protein [Pyrinomonadaceae bacterium]|jgi:hypothetical protein|nr:DUF1203 domain-containing protein [Pyrinomonadaceae bacterium]